MKKISIIMYHYVRDLMNSSYPNIKGLDLPLFKAQIEYLKSHYHIIRMEELIAAVYEGEALPANSALLTFDDGYLDCYTNVLPLLKEHKLQGSFFIPGKVLVEQKVLNVNKIHLLLASDHEDRICAEIFDRLDYYRGSEYPVEKNEIIYNRLIQQVSRYDNQNIVFIKRLLQHELDETLRDRITDDLFKRIVNRCESELCNELYMKERHLKAMKEQGMYIGLHGYRHEWLGKLSQEDMEQDILQGYEVLTDYVDTQKLVINYPYGSYNEEVVRFSKDLGCKVGITTDLGLADLNTDDPLKLPRLDTNDYPPKSMNHINYV
jgi:peptidoglycan/xylan/chitin deacetylase (PgdA/CDA1 family)